MVEHVGMVDMIRDKREEHEYIYETFEYDDVDYSIFFSHYKHLFNVDPDHLKIRITPILMRKIVDEGIVCDKQEYKWRQYLHIHFAKNE